VLHIAAVVGMRSSSLWPLGLLTRGNRFETQTSISRNLAETCRNDNPLIELEPA